MRQPPAATVGTAQVQRPPAPLPADALRRVATLARDRLLGGVVRFLGSSLPARAWHQGEEVPLMLFWQALERPLPSR